MAAPYYNPTHEAAANEATVKSCGRAADLLIVLTAALGFVPLLGFGAWVVWGLVAMVVTVLAIVVMVKGGAVRGVLMMIAAWLFLPGMILVGNVVGTAITAAMVPSPSARPVEVSTRDTAKRRKLIPVAAEAAIPAPQEDVWEKVSGELRKGGLVVKHDPAVKIMIVTLPPTQPMNGPKARELAGSVYDALGGDVRVEIRDRGGLRLASASVFGVK